MEIQASTQLAIPVLQVFSLLVLSTCALLAGRLRLALFINYCFTLYWGYIANLGLFTAAEMAKLNNFTVLYLGSGIVIVLLAMIGLMTRHE